MAATFTNTGILNVASGSTMNFQGGANAFTNLVTGTLTNGTYLVTGTLTIPGNITTNQAKITLTGASSEILNGSSNALSGFLANGNKGSFTLAGNQTFTTSGNFTNPGIIKGLEGRHLYGRFERILHAERRADHRGRNTHHLERS